MDIKTARILFPFQTKKLTDAELQECCDLVEVLSQIFISQIEKEQSPLNFIET